MKARESREQKHLPISNQMQVSYDNHRLEDKQMILGFSKSPASKGDHHGDWGGEKNKEERSA